MTDRENAQAGHFYLIGVGPGAADLLTLRAVEIIRECDVLIAPRSAASEESLALKVVAHLIDRQEVIEHIYPMERNQQRTEECWAEMADLVVKRCSRGQKVGHLTIGDPLLYSTAGYLMAKIAARMPCECWHVVPGVSAFQLSAALLHQQLAQQDDRLILMPATNMREVELALDRCETLVLYKVGRRLKALAELLERRGLARKAQLVCHAGQKGKETILRGLSSVSDEKSGYMSTVIVPIGSRSWSDATVFNDEHK